MADFFFKPYLEAQKTKFKVPKDFDPANPTPAQINAIFSQVQNIKINPKPPSVLFFLRSDNILTDVFFEDTIVQDIAKLTEKVEASLKDFYKNLTDGELNDPKKIANFVGNVVESPAAFYAAQKLMNSTNQAGGKYFAGDWLGKRSLSKTQQENILGAIKEVAGEQ